MAEEQLLWGDTHTHFEDLERAGELLESAREHIDFTVVLLYPFAYEWKNGLRVETTGNRPEHLARWERINRLARDYNQPGRFTTFPGYEWNGNRTGYGDHNVIYLEEGGPLDDAWRLPDLYAALKTRRALAIPHHTGYRTGSRGKDWRFFDPALSPVMELYSQHGSSEGAGAPAYMAYNASMGPGAAGGAYRDALQRGLRLGVIGSNDGPGLPGRWGLGRAAVWAAANTRAAIWEALLRRRTYAVTGDRIRLDFRIGEARMGEETHATDPVDVEVAVTGSGAIDTIELVQNGRVVDRRAHLGRPPAGQGFPGRLKLRLEAGWGPAAHNGFRLPESGWPWSGRLRVEGGRILGLEKCFSLSGQSADLLDPQACEFRLQSAARHSRAPFGLRQGLVFELEAGEETVVELACEGQRLRLTARDLLEQAHLLPLLDEVAELAEAQFGLTPEQVGNPDALYQNARKLLLHRAVPVWDYETAHTFRAVPLAPGENSFYVAATQTNGQRAWSSPVWVKSRP